MTYLQIRAYLDSFINYEKRSAFPYKRSLKLERMHALLAELGNPHENLKSIHVAGTKGKGSVCAFCASILSECGYRVGLYTSPHLSDPRERIRILERGKAPSDFSGMISRDAFIRLVERLEPAVTRFQKHSPWGKITFFEFYTACAFVFFHERKVDYAVIETGLGGRLDATNTLQPLVFGITSIGLDHTATLGGSIGEIAEEKAGIIKPGGWQGRERACISSASAPEASRVIARHCRKAGVKLYEVGKEIRASRRRFDGTGQELDVTGEFGEFRSLRISLPGRHQISNAAAALGLVKALERCQGVRVTGEGIRNGLSRARWPARCEVINSSPVILLDGAHNPDSAKALVEAAAELFPGTDFTAVLGISRDKDARQICSILSSLCKRFFVTRAANRRALSPSVLAGFLPPASVSITENIAQALREARKATPPNGVILVTGSIFVAGEARLLLCPGDHARKQRKMQCV